MRMEPGRFHDATLVRIRQPDRTGGAALPVEISFPLFASVLIFLIAGLLSIALRARLSLGAYRIPLETSLLLSSDLSHYRKLGY
jgi:hypothetical protein